MNLTAASMQESDTTDSPFPLAARIATFLRLYLSPPSPTPLSSDVVRHRGMPPLVGRPRLGCVFVHARHGLSHGRYLRLKVHGRYRRLKVPVAHSCLLVRAFPVLMLPFRPVVSENEPVVQPAVALRPEHLAEPFRLLDGTR